MKKLASSVLVPFSCFLALNTASADVFQFKPKIPKKLPGVGTPKIPLKIPETIPGLQDLLAGKSPITTSISDALTEVPFLDDYDLLAPIRMTTLPRTPEGAFILDRPGDFTFEARSYCLKAGTYSPTGDRGGEGYLHAPQRGPMAEIIRNLIRRTYRHPEIPQENVQSLLWAILARAKFTDISREMQHTAAKLLTSAEIMKINGGAVGLVPEGLKQKALEQLPAAARRPFEAETQIRDMLTRAQSSYEELARVAVLAGDPPPEEGDRKVPSGRWSYRPDGYFIRYFPRGYRQILIELSCPGPVRVAQDELGRITRIVDSRGNSLEAAYDDTLPAMTPPGEPSLRGHRFLSVSVNRRNPDDRQALPTRRWSKVGWTFVGVPSSKHAKQPTATGAPDRFPGFAERYQWSEQHAVEMEALADGIRKVTNGEKGARVPSERLMKIMALAHLSVALKDLAARSEGDSPDGKSSAGVARIVQRAWQHEVATAMRGGGTGHVEERLSRPRPYASRRGDASMVSLNWHLNTSLFSLDDAWASDESGGSAGGGSQPVVFDPSDGMAQPGQGGRQRLNQSGAGAGPDTCRDPEDRDKCIDSVREKANAFLEKAEHAAGEGSPKSDPNCRAHCLFECIGEHEWPDYRERPRTDDLDVGLVPLVPAPPSSRDCVTTCCAFDSDLSQSDREKEISDLEPRLEQLIKYYMDELRDCQEAWCK